MTKSMNSPLKSMLEVLEEVIPHGLYCTGCKYLELEKIERDGISYTTKFCNLSDEYMPNNKICEINI